MQLKERFRIQDAGAFVGKEVTVEGWVTHLRAAGKKLRFIVVRDGSGFMQTVLFRGEAEDAAFDVFDELTQESSVRITGVVKAEPRSVGGHELSVRQVELVSKAEEYPISNKEHGVEFLMEHRHLWLRSQKQWAAARVRSEVEYAIHTFFRDEGFVQFDAPVLTPSACEGTSTLFKTEYFDEEAFLTQSGQLYGEAGAMALGRIYTFGPTFRAEKSKTRKHLTEFWMIEPEMAFANLDDSMALGEGLIHFIIRRVLERCGRELEILERDLTPLKKALEPFKRLHYDEAVRILQEKGFDIPWGEDFGAPHETALGEVFGAPVFIHHFPAQIKAFYFKCEDKYALGCDLIAPDGYGEIIGGGQREESVEVLETRIREHGLSLEDYRWYLDLRRFGSVPHAGFGLGLERTVAWMCGVPHLRECIAFPRMLNQLRP